ncbi:MAG TPA: hypothetical protein VF590_27410 [Isosphaeraceae bacterium]
MTTDLRAANEAVTAAFDRHEGRRERGLPTVSVLAGPVGLALRQARVWAESQGRSVVRVAVPDLDAALDAWAAQVAAEQALPGADVAWLARRLGQPEADFGSRLRRMTPFERETFLDDALTDAAGTAVDLVGRRLLARLAADTPLAPEPPANLAETLVASDLSRHLLATALLELVPVRAAPILLIPAARPDVPGAPTLERWAELAASLVQAEPGLAVVLIADAGSLDAYLGRAAGSRASALVRETIVPVPALDGEALRRRLDDALPAGRRAGRARRPPPRRRSLRGVGRPLRRRGPGGRWGRRQRARFRQSRSVRRRTLPLRAARIPP